jgi:cysteine desulfurase
MFREEARMSRTIYLDYNATTPVDPEVAEAMLPWMTESFWNAASSHIGGRTASRAVENARAQLASLVGSSAQEIVWTSGSTEANNLALKGASATARPEARVLVASTEHKAVLDTAHALERDGIKVEEVPVTRDGLVEPERLAQLMSDDVALVSVMLANNETGVIQPVQELSRLAHEFGAIFHTDATQAIGRLHVDVEELGVDLASISGHKFYGPRGVGALFVRRGTDLDPLIHGGGHERGLRSGTLNVPGIVGMAHAASLARARVELDANRSEDLVDRLVSGFRALLSDVDVVAEHARRLPNTINLRFAGAEGDAVMANAPTVLVSSGSACTAMIPDASHVLLSMGFTQEAAFECLRFSVGRQTTAEEIDEAVHLVAHAVKRVRGLNGWNQERAQG